MTEVEKKKFIKQAHIEMDNSKHKVGDILHNKRTNFTGPIQRVCHSGGVMYYHGNNPCRDEDLIGLTQRRKLNFTR